MILVINRIINKKRKENNKKINYYYSIIKMEMSM